MLLTRKVAEDTSWGRVKDMVHFDILKVGDEIHDMIRDIPMTYQVAEITETEVHFVSKEVFPARVAWNMNVRTKGGFKDSDLRRFLEEKLWDLLPDSMRDVISEREVIQIIDGEEERYKLKLWLPTEYEVFGEAYWNEEAEGQQFSLLKDPANRVKCIAGEEEYCRANWWLLSVASGYSTSACLVSSLGGANGGNASNEFRVPLCFTIMK